MTAIDDKRNELPLLGIPVDAGVGSAEMALPDGRGSERDYENGAILWTPQTGAFEVHGAIRDLWASMGWERSKLGYPVSDEMDMPGGRLSRFEGGEIRSLDADGRCEGDLLHQVRR
jgi:uncharacterized protein with LGFP repeats